MARFVAHPGPATLWPWQSPQAQVPTNTAGLCDFPKLRGCSCDAPHPCCWHLTLLWALRTLAQPSVSMVTSDLPGCQLLGLLRNKDYVSLSRFPSIQSTVRLKKSQGFWRWKVLGLHPDTTLPWQSLSDNGCLSLSPDVASGSSSICLC